MHTVLQTGSSLLLQLYYENETFICIYMCVYIIYTNQRLFPPSSVQSVSGRYLLYKRENSKACITWAKPVWISACTDLCNFLGGEYWNTTKEKEKNHNIF